MDLLSRIKTTISTRGLLGETTPVLLMVSGGSDSTALAYLACQLREQKALGPIKILHVNHGLRGADANADAAFVEALAKHLAVEFQLACVDVPCLCEESGQNMEAVARKARYQAAEDALEDFCRACGVGADSGKIAVAHTLDDRAENFYMRSIVGTGPGGFRSMQYCNGAVVRPLLDVTRAQLRDYLHWLAGDKPAASDAQATEPAAPTAFKGPQGELWREDATNACTDRFRAFVRHEVLPKLALRNPSHLQTLGRTMNQIAEEDDMLSAWADQLLESCAQWDAASTTWLLSPAIAKEPRPLRKRVIAKALEQMLWTFVGPDERLESASVDAVNDAINDGAEGGRIIGGYVANIQGNIAVSANKEGIRIEPMEAFRRRRNKL